MHKLLKENPKTTIAAVFSLIAAIVGGSYTAITATSDFLNEFASKAYVERQMLDLGIEVLNVTIMRYEDELMAIDFLMATETASPMDMATKKNIERRLNDLKVRRDRARNRRIDNATGN